MLFVIFLAINQDKPHCNDINSMGAMIFCSIKWSDVMKLIQYPTYILKFHKSLKNCLINKNYTIFGKENFWIFQI